MAHKEYGVTDILIDSISGLIRTSSVMLAELWRGATKPAE